MPDATIDQQVRTIADLQRNVEELERLGRRLMNERDDAQAEATEYYGRWEDKAKRETDLHEALSWVVVLLRQRHPELFVGGEDVLEMVERREMRQALRLAEMVLRGER